MEFAPEQFEAVNHVWTTNPDAKNDFSVEGDVVWIRLTQGKCACVDREDWVKIKSRRWCAQRSKKTFYPRTRLCDGLIGIWDFLIAIPLGQICDHRKGNGLDNRRQSIRAATFTQNAVNSAKKGKGKFRGVAPSGKSRFRAQISIAGKLAHIGNFDTELAAAAAYDAHARLLYGEFARVNFST